MARKLSKAKTDGDVDYEIGYGKPPVDTRFVKGQSGNPHGRPKGKRNLATMLQAALNETVMITENGKRKQITKLEATFKQIVNKAASGDIASTKLLIQMFPWLETLLDEKATKYSSSEADLQVMKHLQQRLLAEAGRNNQATDNDTEEAV